MYPPIGPGAMTIAEVGAARRNQVPLGIADMGASTAMFAGGNAVVKWQLATYPLGELAFGRILFAFLTVAAIVLLAAPIEDVLSKGDWLLDAVRLSRVRRKLRR